MGRNGQLGLPERSLAVHAAERASALESEEQPLDKHAE